MVPALGGAVAGGDGNDLGPAPGAGGDLGAIARDQVEKPGANRAQTRETDPQDFRHDVAFPTQRGIRLSLMDCSGPVFNKPNPGI